MHYKEHEWLLRKLEARQYAEAGRTSTPVSIELPEHLNKCTVPTKAMVNRCSENKQAIFLNVILLIKSISPLVLERWNENTMRFHIVRHMYSHTYVVRALAYDYFTYCSLCCLFIIFQKLVLLHNSTDTVFIGYSNVSRLNSRFPFISNLKSHRRLVILPHNVPFKDRLRSFEK